MLSEQEKMELLKDARSKQRKQSFRVCGDLQKKRAFSPEKFIFFLEQMNAFFLKPSDQNKTLEGKIFRL